MKWIRSLGIGNSRPYFLLAVIIVMMLVLSLSAAAQNQYYVSTSGNDSNNGTSSSTPWRTCSHAIASFSLGGGGAVVTFAPGNYGAVCTVNRGGSSPTVRLALKCSAQWTPGGSTGCRGLGWLVTSANNVDIGAVNRFGFEYTDPNAQVGVDVSWQCGTAGTCSSGNGIHVLGNYLHDIGQNATGEGVGCPYSGAILAPTGHGHTITDFRAIGNQIDHFGINGAPCNAAHGIYIASANGIVQNNIITRAASAAIQYYDQACNAVISNNVLAASHVGLIVYGGNGCTPGLTTVSNNIIVNNPAGAFNTGYGGANDCTSGRPILFSNNLLFGNGGDYNNSQPSCETRQNQRSENPTATFVNYTGTATGDYHLKTGSIAVSGGTTQCTSGATSQCAPAIDFALVSRSGSPSLGIFEVQGNSNATVPSAPSGLTASVQ